MSFARKLKRKHEKKERKADRTTCPKCHSKLLEKPGYGLVCAECGWWKKPDGGDCA